MNPELVFQSIRQKIRPSWTAVCASVLVCGLLAHAYAFFNYIPNWDGIISYYSDQNVVHLGRCFLTLACGISSYYDLSWVNGVLSLLYIAITAVLVCELLGIRKKSSLVLTGALLATFPSVTSTFAYMYTSDGYMLAMLLMTLAVYLTLTRKSGLIPGALLMMFAFGCYQAYITFAAMLVVVYSLDKLLHEDVPLKALALQWLRAIFCAAAGYALYAVANRILLSLQHVTLADYQGVSALNGEARFAPAAAVKQCLTDFAYFFTGSLRHMNLYSVLNLAMLLLLLTGGISCVVRKKLWRQPARLALAALFAALIPFICYTIYFLTPDVSYHMLMQSGLYFVYVLLIVIYDRLRVGVRRHAAAYEWLCVIVCCVIIYNFILIANICYRTQETSVARSMNELDRIAEEISVQLAAQDGAADLARTQAPDSPADGRQNEAPDSPAGGRQNETPDAPAGTDGCHTLAVIGTHKDSTGISVNLPPDMTGFTDGYIMTHALHYSLLLERYYDLSFEPADNAAAAALAENAAVRAMPCWPEKGSVQIISDTLVIKFSETQPAK